MTTLALHHFSLSDVPPLELVPLAAEVGCQGVCLFVESPAGFAFPMVTPAMLGGLRRRLTDYGVRVTNLEFFSLNADTDPESFRPALELGAALGGQLAVTHIHDTDSARALDSLGRFAVLAGEYDLRLGLEFMPLTPGCTSLTQAVEFVARAGRANVGVGIDALHLFRTGGTPADVCALAPELIAYAQLCDGLALAPGVDPLEPSRYAEEAFARQVPGQGVFPLAELIRALPPDVPLDVEVPQPQQARGNISPLRRARLAVEGARRVLMEGARP